jgi:MarR family transcriptional regulator, organic hydroperoxide resistance regulator
MAKTAPELEPAPADRSTPDALTQLSQSFKRAMAALRRLRGRDTRRPGELRDAQYGLLFGLREHPRLSLSELACAADLSPASATEMLDGLEQGGLVRRERSKRDRRVVLISLTERGRVLVEQRRAEYEPVWRAALSEFSDAELVSAAAVLDRMARLFDEISRE